MIVRDIYSAFLLIIILQAAVVVSIDYKNGQGCPAQCSCYINNPRDGKSVQELSRLKCGISSSEESFMEDLRLYDVDHRIVQLELFINVTRLDNSFLRLDALEKLDLNSNGIEEIDDEAFAYLKNLKRLDLSHNKIKNLHKKIFEPLQSLERLKINNNLIVHLYNGVFDHLISLKALDISGNPLDCDCTIIWVTKWARSNSVKLTQPPKCKSPPSIKGKPLRKLKLHCDDESDWFALPTGLELKPMHNQIVFEGDSLNLRCRSITGVVNGEDNKDAQVTWSWKNKDPISYFDEIKIVNRSFSENGFVESQLKIERIQKSHSGDWYCHLLSEYGNHSTAISVIVLSDDSKYCPQIDTRNNKGTYYWPKTIVGFTVDLPCAIKQPSIMSSKLEPRAFYFCSESGLWENLNTTHCPFVSETTRILEQFSQVNLTIAKGSVLDSAIKLRNFTSNGKNLTDAMDIVFITKTIENYLMFVKNEKELGYILVDIISTIMELHKNLLVKAQKEGSSCSRLVQSIETICKDIPTFQYHKSNMAVEEFGVTGVFSGITCIWYTNAQRDKSSKKFFHCSTNNRTALLGTSDKLIEASIQIPSSLFSHLERKGKPLHNLSPHKWQLILSMYENNNLFPEIANSHEDVTSSVIGSKLVGVEVTNLTDPIYIRLRIPSPSHVAMAKPVWWDQSLYNGSGGWTQDGCESSHYIQGMAVFRCERFGYFGLLQDTRYINDYLNRYNSGKPRLCHPAIYTGSFILIVCLLISVFTYLISHNFIQMSRRLKHSIVNTWFSILLLCFIFSCGIYQTDNIKICQGVGIVIHYLFLSTLLWMSVSASNMYKRLSKSDSLEHAPEDDLPPGVPIQKPILGLYLVGWGIGLIVCGISGAVNLKEYAGKNFCFLESGPALSALFVPAGILLAFLTLFYVLTFCAIRNNDTNGQLSEGTQGTENVDLELLEVPAPMTCVDRRSIQSIVTADSDNIEDPEHSPVIQLKAHIIVLLLYCFIWSLAALSLTDTFQSSLPYHQDICSILYCILAFCLGTFILYFYCVARSDVRSQWTVVKKLFKGKHIHCCRSRSICDTQNNVQMSASTNVPNGASVCQAVAALSSSSVNSSGITVKSNSHNSNRIKAVKKLNNCDAREEHVIRNTTTNNVNLVAMHRKIYRSNNSMPTYHEITGPDCAEAFYNPRQSIVARKFFKKQRRNKRNDLGLRRRGDGGGTSEGEISQTRRTWRPSAESAVFLSSDMENANEKIGSTFFGYNSKVNNTHVSHGNKLRKSHSPKNPNILTDSDEENRNKLLLDRVVIGAKKNNETFVPSKNNDHILPYDYSLGRVEEMSASEEICSSARDTSKPNENTGSGGSPNGVEERCHCQNNCSDSSITSPDYRTVELQCNLGENSYSDINSETNHCDCTMRETPCNGEDDFYKSSQNCRSNSDLHNDILLESGPDCNSFSEKIDKMHLNSESSSLESPRNKIDNYCSMPNSKKYKVLASKLENEKMKTNHKRSANRLSLPPHLDGECEIEALIDQNSSEKTKKKLVFNIRLAFAPH